MLSPGSGKSSMETFYTPCQSIHSLTQVSSSKRSLFRENCRQQLSDSDDESGLAGVSPLHYSDDSPSSSPHKNSNIELNGADENSPFNFLKQLTITAHKSPLKIAFPQLKVPKPSDIFSKLTASDDVVPETPQKYDQLLTETPQKSDSPVFKLITPLNSIRKDPSSIPKIHPRRKILMDDMEESPEITMEGSIKLKRYLENDSQSQGQPAKRPKIDEGATGSKARTALFQEKIVRPLDVKSFYGTQETFQKTSVPNKRPSYQVKYKGSSSARQQRKQFGEINRGVKHGVKRQKPKKPKTKKDIKPEKTESKEKENVNTSSKIRDSNYKPKFLKTTQVPIIKPKATITLNNGIKLNVIGNKRVLDVKKKVFRKRPRLNICMDAMDLSVEESSIEQVHKTTPVNDLIRMLEEDWTDDECEQEDSLQNVNNSTTKNNSLGENILLSAESELSNMTSVMNIEEDSNTLDNKDENNVNKDEDKNLFPLFRKDFSANHAFDMFDKKQRKRKSWQLSAKNGRALNQYHLDLGQKYFDVIHCKECGTVYNANNPEDENFHLNYHNNYRTLNFTGWKNERVVYEDLADRIILVEPNDPKIYWNKINQVLKIVDLDLGLSEVNLCEYQDKRIYLYIRNKQILGVLVAEHKESAHRMIPELLDHDCCTNESTPVKCGINVVWTAMKYRRQKIATKLVDTLRINFYYGYIMTLDDIAFSMPTPSGKIFAERYTNSRDFKVYN